GEEVEIEAKIPLAVPVGLNRAFFIRIDRGSVVGAANTAALDRGVVVLVRSVLDQIIRVTRSRAVCAREQWETLRGQVWSEPIEATRDVEAPGGPTLGLAALRENLDDAVARLRPIERGGRSALEDFDALDV